MALRITLQPDIEARFRAEAAREGLTVEQMAARRLRPGTGWRFISSATARLSFQSGATTLSRVQ
jgi:hypothetical protein